MSDLLKTKWIGYYKPHRWRTIDEWELHLEEVPEEQMQKNITYGRSTFTIGPILDQSGRVVKTLVRLETVPVSSGLSNPAAGAVEVEMWEPANGWRKAVSWSVGTNGKPSVD